MVAPGKGVDEFVPHLCEKILSESFRLENT